MQGTPSHQIVTDEDLSDRHQQILRVGAHIVNDIGAGALKLGQVAKTLNISRNTLYHYVDDRLDLVRQCYHQTCELLEQDLLGAIEKSSDPTDQITSFIDRVFQPDRTSLAVLSDYHMLPEPWRSSIEKRFLVLVDLLASIVANGQKAGVFKQCDARIIAYSLLSIVGWAVLYCRWMSKDDAECQRQYGNAPDVIADWLLNGVAAEHIGVPSVNEDSQSYFYHHFNAFDKAQINEQRRLQLVQAASRLFNQRGISSVSMDDIGAELGATKGAVYHHFKDKTALVEACYDRAFDQYQKFAEVADALGASGFERLCLTFHLNCQAQASHFPPLVLQSGLEVLPPRFLERTEKLSQHLRSAYALGLEDGSIRKLKAPAFELPAGSYFWIQKWRHHFAGADYRAIADTMTDIFATGIAIRNQTG